MDKPFFLMGSAAAVVVAALVLFVTLARVPALAPGGNFGFGGTGSGSEETPEGIVCTADAMQCPDGSWVGRSGPDCTFVCPTGGGSIAPYDSGVRGTLTAGPTCPVERDPPDPNCADKPLSTTVAIYRSSDRTHAYAVLKSDVKGQFQASLPPGAYVLAAGESTLPRCTPVEFSVEPSSYVSVDISCDTGIR